jgi:copper chaperone NosL
MSSPHYVFVAFALLVTACSADVTGPPEIVVDQTACSHCGMYVSEPAYAAAYRAHGKEARVFDDIGCLLDALRQETATTIDVWVQDAAGGGWLDAGDAVFLRSPNVRTPMNGGVLAYAGGAAAEKAAAAQRGEVMSFQELITWKGAAR